MLTFSDRLIDGISIKQLQDRNEHDLPPGIIHVILFSFIIFRRDQFFIFKNKINYVLAPIVLVL